MKHWTISSGCIVFCAAGKAFLCLFVRHTIRFPIPITEFDVYNMSPLLSSSTSVSTESPLPNTFVFVGPDTDDPNAIIWPRMSHDSSKGVQLPGRYRSRKTAGHPLKKHLDVDKLVNTLDERMKSTIVHLNSKRTQSKTNSSDWRQEDRAAWRSEFQSQLGSVSREEDLTFVLCRSAFEYTKALSEYSVGSFSTKEENLMKKFRGVDMADDFGSHATRSKKTDRRPPSRTVKEYKAGHDYDSDPEVCVKPDADDDWDRVSQ